MRGGVSLARLSEHLLFLRSGREQRGFFPRVLCERREPIFQGVYLSKMSPEHGVSLILVGAGTLVSRF